MSEVVEKQLPTQENQVASMFQVLERAATNPDVDVEKMERIYQMVERAEDRQASQSFNAAMVEVQKKVMPIKKDLWNPQTKSWYVDLAQIADQVNHIFTGEGFFLMFSEGECPKETHIRILCDIGHSSGHTVQRHADVPISVEGIGGKRMMTDVHGTGSSFTYGRRYLTVMLANLPTPDNDGNGGQPSKSSNAESADPDSPVIKQLRECQDREDLQQCWKSLKPSERNSIPADVFRAEKKRVGWS